MGLPRRFMAGALAAVGLAACGSSTTATTSSTAPATTATTSTLSTASTTSTVAPTATSTQTTAATGAASVSGFKIAYAAEKVKFSQLGSDLGKAVEGAGSKSNAQLATEFHALSVRAAQQAARLANLRPPAKYANDLAQLTTSFAAVASDLTAIATAATNGAPTAAKSATEQLVRDAAKVKAHDTALTTALGLRSQG
jgi:hypothetical protein